MTRFIVVAVLAWALPLQAQVRVTGVESVPLRTTYAWGGVRFSPDGARVYLTPPDYRGIWEHTIATGGLRVHHGRPGVGIRLCALRRRQTDCVPADLLRRGVAVAPAGDRRRGPDDRSSRRRSARRRSVGTPVFAGDQVIVQRPMNRDLSAPAENASVTAVLGIEQIEDRRDAGGARRLLEPLGAGRYVWPVLSPDRSRLAAYELRSGSVRVPSWTGRRPSCSGRTGHRPGRATAVA